MLDDPEGPDFGAPTALGGTTVGLHVFVDDGDALARQATAAGAQLPQPPAGRFHGHRTAVLKDLSGRVGGFLTDLEDLTPAASARRAGRGPPRLRRRRAVHG